MFLHPLLAVRATPNFFKQGTYTGNITNRSFTGFTFSPNLTLIKRTNSANDFALQNTVTGISEALATNGNNPATTGLSTWVTSFDSDGFSIGTSTQVNANTQPYAYWSWDIATNYLDVVTYTGNGSNRTIAHSLGIAPSMMLIKNRTAGAANWIMYHTNMSNGVNPEQSAEVWAGAGATKTTSATYFNNTAPTSSVFSVGTNLDVNNSGDSMIAFLFGLSTGSSKFGTYSGNGSASGPTVTGLGFTPSVVLIVKETAAANKVWLVYGNNLNTSIDQPAATDTTNYADLISDGFQIKTTNADFNTSGQRYLYAAWR